MKAISLLLSALLILALGTGCETMMGPSPETLRRDQEVQDLAQSLKELKIQIATVQKATEVLAQDLESLKAALRGSTTASAVQARIDALEKQVQALNRGREQDLKAMADKVAGLVAGGSGASHAAGSSKSGNSSEYGYEHEVKPGQTLSEIAKAYSVSVSAIVKANHLKDEHSLRVGQKLFIPESK